MIRLMLMEALLLGAMLAFLLWLCILDLRDH